MIALLARGKSLKRYAEMNHLFDTVYICGRFHKEIRKIGKNYFKHKKIIHVTCRGPAELRNNYYKKLNVKYIQTASHSIEKQFCTRHGKQHSERYPKNIDLRAVPKKMRDRGFPPLECRVIEKFCNKFDDYKKLSIFLEETMPKEIEINGKKTRRSRRWPTTGIFALDLILNEKPDKVYIFGLDLYTGVSFTNYKNMGEEYHTPIDDATTRLAFYHLRQLVEEFPVVEFKSVSKSKKFNFNLPNWSLI